jgi:Holliday junction resolvasome RuvABC endonuclease subunit
VEKSSQKALKLNFPSDMAHIKGFSVNINQTYRTIASLPEDGTLMSISMTMNVEMIVVQKTHITISHWKSIQTKKAVISEGNSQKKSAID